MMSTKESFCAKTSDCLASAPNQVVIWSEPGCRREVCICCTTESGAACKCTVTKSDDGKKVTVKCGSDCKCKICVMFSCDKGKDGASKCDSACTCEMTVKSDGKSPLCPDSDFVVNTTCKPATRKVDIQCGPGSLCEICVCCDSEPASIEPYKCDPSSCCDASVCGSDKSKCVSIKCGPKGKCDICVCCTKKAD